MLLFHKRILLAAAFLLAAIGNAQTTITQPPGYSFCSAENGTCNFSGTAYVAYGANGSFVFRNMANSTACTNAAFGEDPAPGIAKSCFVPTDPPEYIYCSSENAICNFSTTDTVAYGANGQFVSANFTNLAPCSNSGFGHDPAPGVVKHCFIPAWPPAYNFCSYEGGTCNLGGSYANVAYGENGNFVYRQFTTQASTPCTTAAFGGVDPAPGSLKKCLISGYTPTPPYGYSLCSSENGTCPFSGTLKIVYGAGGNFTSKALSNGTACNNTVFGEDPAPGTVKACYIPTDPPGYALCSNENGTCSFSGTATVAFGANGNFNFKSIAANGNTGTACTSAVFGDPAPGTLKACYIPAGPAGTSFCSSEHGTCNVGGPNVAVGIVYFGFDGAFLGKSFSPGSVTCESASFSGDQFPDLTLDPVPGVTKACFVQTIAWQ